MKPEAIETILRIFCNSRGLDVSILPKGAKDAVIAVSTPFYLFVECLEPAGIADSENPVDGLLITLTRRTFDSVSGTIALAAIGHLQEAEALSRTVLEGSATLLYVLQENSGQRLVTWFHAYIEQEHDQNRRWKNDLQSASASLRADHMARIANKEEVLSQYRAFVEHFADQIGADRPGDAQWPDLYQRMAALGRTLEYRTVYAALCSQAHHDAEDILNELVAGSVPDDDKFSARVESERDAFSVYMVLFAEKCFLDCMVALGHRFGFSSVILSSKESLTAVTESIHRAIHDLENGLSPRDWLDERRGAQTWSS